jgi:hypothetical protein
MRTDREVLQQTSGVESREVTDTTNKILPPGTRDVIQCCWPDGKQRTSYVSFPRAFRRWLVGRRRTKAGRERAKN